MGRTVTFDIEANGFLDTATKIHCVKVKDYKTGELFSFWGEQMEQNFKDFSKEVDHWIIHNGLTYDFPMLEKHFNFEQPDVSKITDTLIWSRLFDPDRRAPWDCKVVKAIKSPHGLECWGYRVGLGKPEIDEWEGDMINDVAFRKRILNRCSEDVEINERVYKALLEEKKGFSTFSTSLERKFREVMFKMEQKGFYLNQRKASELKIDLDILLVGIEKEVRESFKPEATFEKVYEPKYTKDGTLSTVGLKGRFQEADDVSLAAGDLAVLSKGAKTFSDQKKIWVASQKPLMKANLAEAQAAFEDLIVGPFSFFFFKEFELGSPSQVVSRLNEAGWNPTERTKSWRKYVERHQNHNRNMAALKRRNLDEKEYKKEAKKISMTDEEFAAKGKTCWKVNEENLNTIPETAPQSAKLIADFLLLRSRSNTISQWFDALAPDGRVHGRITTVGAWTQRCSHQSPNMANLPKVYTFDCMRKGNTITNVKTEETFDVSEMLSMGYSVYMQQKALDTPEGEKLELPVLGRQGKFGYEMRGCFTVDDTRRRCIVGSDASGIQLRALAHYMNDEEYIYQILSGDIHIYNQKMGAPYLKTRGQAKTLIYAFLLGAGLVKLGSIAGCIGSDEEKMDVGKKLKKTFLSNIPALEDLIEEAHRRAKIGYMIGLDGRRIPVPSKHLSLTAYLQGFESVIMKMAIVRWWNVTRKEGLDAWPVAFVHDELQMDCAKEHAERAGEAFVEALEWAGKKFNCNMPITGEYLVGETWADAH